MTGTSNVRVRLTSDAAIRAHIDRGRRERLRADTLRHREQVLRMVDAWLLAHRGVDLLHATDQMLNAWQTWLTSTPIERTGEPRSIDTMTTYSSHLRMFYRWARRTQLIRQDPADELPVPRELTEDVEERVIDEDDLRLAIRCADGDLKVWLVLASQLGLRRGEIARIERADVHDREDRPVLRVRGKGGRNRTLPLTPAVLLLLSRYLTGTGPLFRTSAGRGPKNRPVTPRVVGERFKAHFDRLGMGHYSAHWCRHRTGTVGYRKTKDIRAVQKLLGHAKVSTTQIYAHEADDAIRCLAEELGMEIITERHLHVVRDEDASGDSPS